MINLNLKYGGHGDYYCGICESRNKNNIRFVYSFYDNMREPTEQEKKLSIARHIDEYHKEENKIIRQFKVTDYETKIKRTI